MLNIKKHDVIIGYFAYFVKYFSSFIILPFIATGVIPSEYAVWSIFLAVNTFIYLLDLGYGVVISRYTLFVISGIRSVEDLDNTDLARSIDIESQEINQSLFSTIIKISKRKYFKLSIIGISILFLISPYIYYISKADFSLGKILILWAIFITSVFFHLISLSNSTIIKGMGKVREMNIITIVTSLLSLGTKIVLLQFGYGIFALTFSLLLDSIILLVSYKIILYSFQKKHLKIGINELNNDLYIKLNESVNKKTKGISLVLFSNFIQNQMFTLLAPIFISLALLGRYQFSWQLVSMVSSLSAIAYNTYRMKLANYSIRNENEKYKKSLYLIFSIYLILFTIGSMITLLFMKPILILINSEIELLHFQPLLLMLLYSFMVTIVHKTTDLLSLENDQRYVKSLTISSISILIISTILLSVNFTVYSLTISGIIVYSIYNIWKWPRVLIKKHALNLLEYINVNLSYFKNLLFKFKLLKKKDLK